MKWIGVAVLVVIGIIAAFVAIEYLVVPIHSLPSFMPGHKNANGHYHKRGAIAAVVAIVALGAALVFAVRFTRPESETSAPAPTAPVGSTTPSSVDDLLSGPAADEGNAPRS